MEDEIDHCALEWERTMRDIRRRYRGEYVLLVDRFVVFHGARDEALARGAEYRESGQSYLVLAVDVGLKVPRYQVN